MQWLIAQPETDLRNVCVYDTAAQIMSSSLLNWLDDGTQ